MAAEILTIEPAANRSDGLLYVRYAEWRDDGRKTRGEGDYQFRRPDGGVIRADLLNDHKIQIPPLGRQITLRAEGNPQKTWVHHLPTDRWVDAAQYTGPLSELEFDTWTIDAEREFILPAIARFRARLERPGQRWGDRTGTTLNLIVAAGTMIGVDSRLAKIAAIGASFTATWLLRKRVVFQ
jgi:hypothetical protein